MSLILPKKAILNYEKTVILVILDGWGIGSHDQSNPIYAVKPKNIQEIKKDSLSVAPILRHCHRPALGRRRKQRSRPPYFGSRQNYLPTLPQNFVDYQRRQFFSESSFKNAFAHAKKIIPASTLSAFFGTGNVHSSFEHLTALLELAKRENFDRIYLQLFTDGRDSPPKSAPDLLQKLEKVISEKNRGILASLSGRFYALDRAQHWERTEKAYRTLIGEGKITASYQEILNETYGRNLNDAFVEPSIVGSPLPFKTATRLSF